MKKMCQVVVMSLAATVAFAADYMWVPTSGTGSFQTGANWTNSVGASGVPGTSDNAKFTSAGTYGVSFAGNATNVSTTVGADVTFGLGGYSWLLSGGLTFSGTSTARFGGGALEVVSPVTVANNQKLILDSGASVFSNTLSTSSGGAIEVRSGNHAWQSLFCSTPPSGGASFRMTNGTVSVSGDFISSSAGAVYSLESGTLLIPPGGRGFQLQNAYTFNVYTNATIDYRATSRMYLSYNGSANNLNIIGGTFTNTGVNLVLGSPVAFSTSMVHLVDGLFYSSKPVYAGGVSFFWGSSNVMNVLRQSGGRLQFDDTFYLGSQTNSMGVYTQSGGTAWCKNVRLGCNGTNATGKLYLTGGRLETPNALHVGYVSDCSGSVFLTGGELSVSNAGLVVGNALRSSGTLTVSGGTLMVPSGSLTVGSAAGSVGAATISGGESFFNGVTVGILGAGSLAIGGGVLTLTNNGSLTVGSAAGSSGTLTISGGTVMAPNGALTVGSAAGSSGTSTISGGENFFKGIMVGDLGTGTLAITGGMLTLTNSGSLMVGNNAGSVGTLEISGGTNNLCGAGTTIGQKGVGFARFSGGYTYTTNRFVVGGGSNGVGRLELCGGILSTPIIDGRDMTLTNGNPGGYSEVLFDGGTLQHSVDAEWWMPGGFVSTFGKATLTDRGAVIDSNGGTLTITQTMSNEVGYAGSFTKTGAGKVTLSSWYNAFTGRVAVEQGELAVSGGIYLTGGVAIDAGALLNLASAGAIPGSTTAPGTVSRVDGALTLKSGTVLTIGAGAALGGTGVVTGSVVFATGSTYARNKADGSGVLQVTDNTAVQDGVTVALTGYALDDLAAGIPLVTAVAPGTLQVSEKLPVTLDGASHPYWWAVVSADGKTLSARVIPLGTLIKLW